MIGVIISLAGETSDYVDPLTFTFATVSILVAIVGIALAFKMPSEDTKAKNRLYRSMVNSQTNAQELNRTKN
jgi:hypothetical protein